MYRHANNNNWLLDSNTAFADSPAVLSTTKIIICNPRKGRVHRLLQIASLQSIFANSGKTTLFSDTSRIQRYVYCTMHLKLPIIIKQRPNYFLLTKLKMATKRILLLSTFLLSCRPINDLFYLLNHVQFNHESSIEECHSSKIEGRAYDFQSPMQETLRRSHTN